MNDVKNTKLCSIISQIKSWDTPLTCLIATKFDKGCFYRVKLCKGLPGQLASKCLEFQSGGYWNNRPLRKLDALQVYYS